VWRASWQRHNGHEKVTEDLIKYFMRYLNICGRQVGEQHPVFMIAEIGSNHNLDKTVVKALIDTSYSAGFNAVKFQTYEPLEVFSGKITTREVNYEKLYGYKPWWKIARDHILMPRQWFEEMFEYVRRKNMMVFSTVHSVKDAEFIMKFDPPLFKVASIDVTHLEFLGELAKFKKPILLSTGMSYLREIDEAIDTIVRNGNDELALLHCVSCYPPKPEDVNLRNIVTLRDTFNVPVGFSDHSPSNFMAVASVALGACILEKHVTLDRNMEGPDHPFSIEPEMTRDLVRSVREVEAALGTFKRNLSSDELESRRQTRRSIVAKSIIKKGELLDRSKLKFTRPGTGIEPKYIEYVAGRKAKVDIEKEEIVTIDMLE